MNILPQTKRTFLCYVVLVWSALPPTAHATCQNGCLAGDNTVLGDDALTSLTTGGSNTAIGSQALFNNTTGGANVAVGWSSLYYNTTGSGNTALGYYAMFSATTGGANTAIGNFAFAYSSGTSNTAVGDAALENNSGDNNTATGLGALGYNTGAQNTATGNFALQYNGPGSNNTAVGYFALKASTNNNNIAVGSYAGSEVTTGGNNIDIGNSGASADNKTIRIGVAKTHRAAFVAGINGATVPGGVGVIIDASGHLGTVTSSGRFKEAIKPMDKSSEVLLALQPVTFRYKKELDPKAIPHFGLVAEDVAKVDPDLVALDDEGKPYTVRYEAVNAMLLNEFLKEHRKVEEQSSRIAQQDRRVEEQATINQRQEATIARLEATLKAQGAQIQKVSEEVNERASISRVVAHN
jgi:hypothetical protein